MAHCSPEAEYHYAQQVLKQLASASCEVIGSYAQAEGEEQFRPSPFIAHWNAASLEAPEFLSLPAIVRSGLTVLEEVIEEPCRVDLQYEQRGGMRVIADQAACPFKAFAKHRLSAYSLETEGLGISSQQHGTLLHAALEHLWGTLKNNASLRSMTEEAERLLIEESAAIAMSRYRAKAAGAAHPVLERLEQIRLQELLQQYLQIEKQRPLFEVLATEAEETIKVSGLQLRIKADRLDRYRETGTLAILDYKTGRNVSPRQWMGDRPEAPQLPLYTLAADQPVSAVLFTHLAKGQIRLHGWSEMGDPGASPPESQTMSEVLTGWRQVIEQLASQFVQGVISRNPKNGAATCRSCGLDALCRRTDAQATSFDENGCDGN